MINAIDLKTYKKWKSVDNVLIYMSRLIQGLFDFSLSSTSTNPARHLRRGRHGICNALHGWKHPQGGHRWILLSKCTERIGRVAYGKQNIWLLVFQMSNKEMKN